MIEEVQLKEIMTNLDVNSDGRISFEEFEYWWNTGRKGGLERLVFMKAKAMKMMNFLKKWFLDEGINLDVLNTSSIGL